MWIEQAESVAMSSIVYASSKPKPAVVAYVKPGSIGEELGFEPGDSLVSINGIQPRDLIDYKFLIVEEELHLEVLDINGIHHHIDLEKDSDDELGLGFTEALFDGLRQCNNKCSFCFIDQQPSGQRKSLYLKDDDFRLSFLYGSYLTLTNLTEADWLRIETQRLSPLFVSVHATNPHLRSKLLKNPRGSLLLEQLSWFSKRGLQIHAQIVVCPGINDQEALEESLTELAKFGEGEWPAVLSTAVVPVGLTKFRPSSDAMKPVDEVCARTVIKQVEKLQLQFKEKIGSSFAWLSDEWYLIGGKALPPRKHYEDLPQQENGVGSIRAFLEEISEASKKLPTKLGQKRSCSWVVGRLVVQALTPISEKINLVEGLTLFLYGLPSQYWGQDKVVTGLLTGEDLLKGLSGKELGEELLLPSVMLKEGEAIFLDGMTVEELGNTLEVEIRIVHGADDIMAAVIGEV